MINCLDIPKKSYKLYLSVDVLLGLLNDRLFSAII